MDEISNKALLIGVGLFVTIIITSGVLYTLGEMKNIYSKVYETNISLQDVFSEYEQYDNTTKTGIDVLNTMKKYKENNSVIIYVGNTSYENVDKKNNYIQQKKDQATTIGQIVYKSTVNLDEDTGIVTIIFSN